ncbi:MAG: aspartate kinase [Anaerolineae bacterium]|nr:aspartate kinase [Anaerolineae bacterium]
MQAKERAVPTTAIVHKFGGTSVGSAERFCAVADIIAHHHGPQGAHAPSGAVVVVSAMGGVTNALLNGAWAATEGREATYRQVRTDLLARHLAVVDALFDAGEERNRLAGRITDQLSKLERLYDSIAVLGELTARGRDHVAAFGEMLSVEILAACLRERGVAAQALLATDLVVTDDHFGAAIPLMDKTRARLQARLVPLLVQGITPVVTGFIAATEDGVTTTLGRGGSDYTAAIIGTGLHARRGDPTGHDVQCREVWIWSDVDGILTADPNLVPAARPLRELSYVEAAELAYYGADVLHPKTIRPVIENQIPLRILNSFNAADPGTLIVDRPSATRVHLPAIISTRGLSLIAVGGLDDYWSLHAVARALQALSDDGIDVLMFSQSFSEHNLNLIVRRDGQARCLRTLQTTFAAELDRAIVTLGTKEQVATVSVVGVPGWNATGTVSHAFAALGAQGTRVIAVAQAATEHSVSFCIPEDQVTATVRFLHKELGLESG